MRQITKTVYQFSELSESVQAKILDAMRDYETQDSYWSEYILDDAKDWLKVCGFYIDDIYFSGFWSQGDGACFTGSFYASGIDLEKLKDFTNVYSEFAARLESLKAGAPTLSAGIKHRGHYQHEMCTEFDVETDGDDLLDEYETDSREYRELREKLRETENDFIELARDMMRYIYSALEKECEYRQSDEAVRESIEANALEFDVEGNLT